MPLQPTESISDDFHWDLVKVPGLPSVMSRHTMMTVGTHITLRFQPTQKPARLKRAVDQAPLRSA